MVSVCLKMLCLSDNLGQALSRNSEHQLLYDFQCRITEGFVDVVAAIQKLSSDINKKYKNSIHNPL